MDYLFENVNVFDGEHESLIKNTCVYVSNGKSKRLESLWISLMSKGLIAVE